jgi:hypothetical protein
VATLTDPFDVGACHLGFGTLLPTQLGTMFVRGQFTCASDGSFYVAQLPWLDMNSALAPVIYQNTGYTASTGATGLDYANRGAFTGMMQEARLVSSGIKVMPLVAATATPGVLYAGSFQSASYNQIVAVPISTNTLSPQLRLGYGVTGAVVTSRPQDPVAFQFASYTINAPAANSTQNTSVPYIAGTGFPANTSVVFEAVVNFEFLIPPGSANIILELPLESDGFGNDGLSNQFSSIENMWNSIRSWLPESVSMKSAGDLMASSARAALRAGASGLIRSYWADPNASVTTHLRRTAQDMIAQGNNTLRRAIFSDASPNPLNDLGGKYV